MCKVPAKLRELVKQRLAAAAEEIFELLERTITEYEEELISKYDIQRKRDRTLLYPKAECPDPPHIEEDTTPPSEFEDIIGVSLKSEDEEEQIKEDTETWTQPVHHNQTVDCPEPPVPEAPSGDHLLHHGKCQRKTQVNSHICLCCGKVYPSNSKLESHVRVHTGERPFICSVCGKTFAQKRTLNCHMSLHTGEKPYSCSVCGKRFSVKGNMEQHKKIHSGLKPHTCTVCGQAFAQKSHLNDHLLVHTGEKPFSCSVCGNHFRQKSSLNKHMSTHR